MEKVAGLDEEETNQVRCGCLGGQASIGASVNVNTEMLNINFRLDNRGYWV